MLTIKEYINNILIVEKIKEIIDLIDKSIKQDPEITITWWEIIADNYDEEVDKYRSLINNSKDWLTDYQSRIANENDINWLKIKYTNASGYFIEVPKSQVSKIPDSFVHKQTLVNASRYITWELKEFETEVLEAEWKKAEREYEIFLDIREKILDNYATINNVSENIAHIDFVSSMSQVAYDYDYVRPELGSDYNFEVKSGRHPIIEQVEKDFISNDLSLEEDKYIHIITGPNMGWKSTFLRQNALILLLAHIGSFVPAKKAKLPLTDKIFSRVWAWDNLFLGQSTFMVEMQEVANILNNSTKDSFVIIDEVGRWTSTYDGMSLAWAILKENHDNIKAKTLFATHYHELIDESKNLSWVKNFSVAVWEEGEELVFLRKIIEWWIKKSFWLQVAKLAWISTNTINEAKKMLHMLELEHNSVWWVQMSLWSNIEPEIKIVEKEIKIPSIIEQELEKLDINNLTPMEALTKINEFKEKIKN